MNARITHTRCTFPLFILLVFFIPGLLLPVSVFSQTADAENEPMILDPLDWPLTSEEVSVPGEQDAETALPQDYSSLPELEPEQESEVVLPPLVVSGRTISGIIDLASGTNYVTYRFDVPEDAMRVAVSLHRSQADLDLYVRYGSDILDYSMVDAKADDEDYNETLNLSRFGDEGLYNGEYYLDVVYQREFPPRRNGRVLNQISFDLTVDFFSLQAEETISSGEQVSGILKPSEGMMKLYAVHTVGWDSALRIDISDTTGDIDLFISRDNPFLTPETAEYSSESLLGRETIIIDKDSYPSFSSGTYYVLLVDQVSNRFPVVFSLWTSNQAEPPEALLSIPPIPDPDETLQHAIASTVEVIGSVGRGSGCLVSGDGYLLTNWHVVRDGENNPSEPVYVAVTLNQHLPPKELFIGRVERYDEDLDLALVKITSGRYSQPIPGAYRFPYFEIGDNEAAGIGQPISILGYPSNGGIGSRVSITLTRGIISGFEASPQGSFIKTDGEISFGNSGGAVFDAFGELLGLPVSIYTDGEGKLGFILPVTLIPPSWLKIIAGNH